jgi:hypothetical protein
VWIVSAKTWARFVATKTSEHGGELDGRNFIPKQAGQGVDNEPRNRKRWKVYALLQTGGKHSWMIFVFFGLALYCSLFVPMDTDTASSCDLSL